MCRRGSLFGSSWVNLFGNAMGSWLVGCWVGGAGQWGGEDTIHVHVVGLKGAVWFPPLTFCVQLRMRRPWVAGLSWSGAFCQVSTEVRGSGATGASQTRCQQAVVPRPESGPPRLCVTGTQPPGVFVGVCSCLCSTTADLSGGTERSGLQSLRCSLSGPSQRKFHGLWSRPWTLRLPAVNGKASPQCVPPGTAPPDCSLGKCRSPPAFAKVFYSS